MEGSTICLYGICLCAICKVISGILWALFVLRLVCACLDVYIVQMIELCSRVLNDDLRNKYSELVK